VKTVHVAVEAHNLVRDDRGIGRYARAVLSRAVRDPGFRWTFVVRDLLPRRAPIARALAGAPLDRVRIARRVPGDADVVWFPWNGTFLRTGLPSVATVHDAAPFAFPAADARRRATEQEPFLLTARTARTILVQSAFTASEVESRLGVERERIVVTPLAVDRAVFSPLPAVGNGESASDDGGARAASRERGLGGALPPELRGRRYVLHVGAHDERKNSRTLIEAFASAFPEGDVGLAFTRRPPSMPRGAAVVAAPDDATLVTLYRHAALVAVPSPYEGFGLPLLEAMACGAAALAARAGALPEVGADATEWIDDPLDAPAWSAALRTLLADDERRSVLAKRGLARAATFSWDRCTEQTLSVLRETASCRRTTD